MACDAPLCVATVGFLMVHRLPTVPSSATSRKRSPRWRETIVPFLRLLLNRERQDALSRGGHNVLECRNVETYRMLLAALGLVIALKGERSRATENYMTLAYLLTGMLLSIRITLLCC